MTRHREIQARLRGFVDGELPQDLAHEVRAHLDDCAECASELAALRAVQDALLAVPDATPIAPMWNAVRRRRERPSKRFSWTLALRTSAFGLAGVLIGLLLGTVHPASTEAESTDLWTDLGSTYGTEAGSSLSDEYLTQLDETEEPTP